MPAQDGPNSTNPANMSKRSSDGDVLSNRLSLGLAKRQKLLASLMGPPEDEPATNDTFKNENEDAELEEVNFGHDRYFQISQNG